MESSSQQTKKSKYDVKLSPKLCFAYVKFALQAVTFLILLASSPVAQAEEPKLILSVEEINATS